MKHLFFIGLMTLVGLYSCNNDDQSIDRADLEKLYDQNSNLKREFGRALLNAMKESKMLRSVLKTEALKMFDKDYDVLYYSIEDKLLEHGSVEELMAKHLGGKEKLDEIISQYPTLTIFVPELPNHSFSAELWNTQTVPAVAIRTRISNDVPFIHMNGTEDIILAKYTPGFPILVIKDNERVVALNDENHKWFSQLETKTVYNGGWVRLKFWNNAFDPSKTPIDQKKRLDFDPKVKKAYEIYKNVYGFQRDYIYYNITPSDTIGQYNNEYKEYITSFSMRGQHPEIALSKIANQTRYSGGVSSAWTDGFFEFAVIADVNGKNTGAQTTAVFPVRSDDLFTIEYERLGDRFRPLTVSLKTAEVCVPFFAWKLEEYSSAIKLRFEEVDLRKIVMRTETRTVGHATNFSFNTTSGLLEKIGLGTGLTEAENKTYEIAYFKINDFLGEAIINFADDVLIGDGTITIEYSTGLCKFSVMPLKVE